MKSGMQPAVQPREPWLPQVEGRPRRGRPSTARDEPGDAHRAELSAADAAEVHRFVARRVANSADAADIAQEALLHALSKRGTCRAENHRPWLFTIARHLIVDHYRARNRFQFLEAAALADTEPALQTRPDAVLGACVDRERMSCLMGCVIRRLRPEEQVAVLLANFYGHRDKDSAAVLRMSLPSFKLLLHGARARLREIAGGSCLLVRRTSGADCHKPANGHGGKSCGRGRSGRSSTPPTRRVGVVCPLGHKKLLSLRGRLLDGLRLSCLSQLITGGVLDAVPFIDAVPPLC